MPLDTGHACVSSAVVSTHVALGWSLCQAPTGMMQCSFSRATFQSQGVVSDEIDDYGHRELHHHIMETGTVLGHVPLREEPRCRRCQADWTDGTLQEHRALHQFQVSNGLLLQIKHDATSGVIRHLRFAVSHLVGTWGPGVSNGPET